MIGDPGRPWVEGAGDAGGVRGDRRLRREQGSLRLLRVCKAVAGIGCPLAPVGTGVVATAGLYTK